MIAALIGNARRERDNSSYCQVSPFVEDEANVIRFGGAWSEAQTRLLMIMVQGVNYETALRLQLRVNDDGNDSFGPQPVVEAHCVAHHRVQLAMKFANH